MSTDPRLQAEVEKELEPGEQVLWTGRPGPARAALQYGVFFLFGIFWSGFLVNFMGHWQQGGGDTFGGLFMIPFVAVGLGMLLSPAWAYLRALKTIYAITGERVLIIQHGASRRVQSYGKADIGRIGSVERPNKSGDLAFAQQQYRDRNGYTRTRDVSFLGIAEVRQVERVLQTHFDGRSGMGRDEVQSR